ncbi:MAG: hypothetical protein HC933_05165 [Pleurocapsa sp. SU_196_0]|nr:hypothetical protein [Pleurocapsa sp. SU_196_0]
MLEIPQHLMHGLTRLKTVKWLDSLWTQAVAVVLLIGIVGLLVLGVFQAQRELTSRDADEARVVSLETLERSASRAQFLAADMNGWQTAYASSSEASACAAWNATARRGRDSCNPRVPWMPNSASSRRGATIWNPRWRISLTKLERRSRRS